MSLKDLGKLMLNVGDRTAAAVAGAAAAAQQHQQQKAKKAQRQRRSKTTPAGARPKVAANSAVARAVREARAAPVDHTAENLALLKRVAVPAAAEKRVRARIAKAQAAKAAPAPVKSQRGKRPTKKQLFGTIPAL